MCNVSLCVFFTSVKRSFAGYITCLKDFVNDPRREEPLIGMVFCSINCMPLNLLPNDFLLK